MGSRKRRSLSNGSCAPDAYRALRPLLFSLDTQRANDLVLSILAGTENSLIGRAVALERVDDPVEIAGIVFPNQVGLAAGLDKAARCLPALASTGFGFIEVGSVAARREAWSEPPRSHRFPQAQALINRVGLHQEGLDAQCAALGRNSQPLDRRASVPVRSGVNLACNSATRYVRNAIRSRPTGFAGG